MQRSSRNAVIRPGKSNTPGAGLINKEIRNKRASHPQQKKRSIQYQLPPSVNILNWSQPDELIPVLKSHLRRYGYVDVMWGRLDKVHQSLISFKKRVEKASGRFRHPSCRAVHALLAMGGYDRINSMGCCGTYKANENPFAKTTKGYCQRRRFCSSCAWWASRETISKFLRAFPEHRARIHAFTLSWTFPAGQVGILARTDATVDEHDYNRLIQDVWNLGEDALRTITSRCSSIVQGCLMVESLTATGLMPLQFNPHFHGLVCCDSEHLGAFREALERGIPQMPGFDRIAPWGLRPSVRFEPLPTNYDFIRFVSYAFAAFGLGRTGSCLDDVYDAAWQRCLADSDRKELNREVAFWVRAFDHACFDRRRTVLTGVFWHRHKETLKARPSKANEAYVDQLYRNFEEEEIASFLEKQLDQ